MQPEAHFHGVAVPPGEYPLAAHFGSPRVQTYAARFGMWLFLATEVLLFAGLFIAYATYRYIYPQTFALASRHLNLTLGTVNTLVLITSSLTVALAIHFVRTGFNRTALLCLLATIAFALTFLVIKYFEYSHKFEEGTLPGRFYTFEGLRTEGAPMFFAIYFLATGLHGLHVVIGMSVLIWVAFHVWRGGFFPPYYTPGGVGGVFLD